MHREERAATSLGLRATADEELIDDQAMANSERVRTYPPLRLSGGGRVHDVRM